MIGKKILEWDSADIIKGVSTSSDLADGGFDPITDAVQLTNTPGVMFQPAQPTDQSTNANGQMIASCEDPTGSYARLFVSTSLPDGHFFSMSSSFVLTVRGTTDSTHTYVQGRVDMIAFAGEAYITSSSTIVRWSSIGSSNTFDTSFFTFTSAFAPHPALNYNNFAYYGDGNLLLRQSAAGSVPTTILTLPAGWIIVSLGIDPGSGNMLISVIGQVNLSDTINSGAHVLFYNGASTSYQRSVAVDDMVTAFAATEGALYAAYGQSLGLWNGSGVTFLRALDVAFDNEQLLYKQHFTSIGSTLYYIQKNRIYAYGPVRQKGENVFYPAFYNAPSGTPVNLSHITNVGQNNLAYAYATSKFFVWNSNSVSTPGSQSLFTNFYQFDNEYWIRWIRVVWKNQVTNNIDPGTMRLYDQDGPILAVNPDVSGNLDLKNTSGAASAIKDLININVRVKELKLDLILDTVNAGIRRIIVYGELADRP